MKIYEEKRIENFEFWSGAKDTAKRLTPVEFEKIENVLEDLYLDGIDETTLNDIFWFDIDFIFQCIFDDYDELTAEELEERFYNREERNR